MSFKRWFVDMRVSFKLAAIGLSFSLPILVLLYFVINVKNHDINFSQWEFYGDDYQRVLERLLQHVPEHRLLAASLLSGNAGAREALAAKQSQIDADFTALAEVDRRLGGFLNTTPEELKKKDRDSLATMQGEWGQLKAGVSGMPLEKADADHVHLIADIRNLISHVGDASNLILDPDLDTYYLMDVTLLALPQTQDRLQEIVGFVRPLVARGALSTEERVKLAVYAALLQQSDVDRVKGSAGESLKEDANFLGTSASLQSNLPPAVAEYASANEALVALLEKLAASDAVAVGAAEVDAVGARALATSFKLWDTSASELDKMLVRRVESTPACGSRRSCSRSWRSSSRRCSCSSSASASRGPSARR
ncbi:MAG: hypothetical protein U0166_11320 [Acidobacteriota bacterium]